MALRPVITEVVIPAIRSLPETLPLIGEALSGIFSSKAPTETPTSAPKDQTPAPVSEDQTPAPIQEDTSSSSSKPQRQYRTYDSEESSSVEIYEYTHTETSGRQGQSPVNPFGLVARLLGWSSKPQAPVLFELEVEGSKPQSKDKPSSKSSSAPRDFITRQGKKGLFTEQRRGLHTHRGGHKEGQKTQVPTHIKGQTLTTLESQKKLHPEEFQKLKEAYKQRVHLHNWPQTASNIILAERFLNKQDMLTCVTAIISTLQPVNEITTHLVMLAQKTDRSTRRHFVALRGETVSSDEAATTIREIILSGVEKPDYDPRYRKVAISASYTIVGNWVKGENAAEYGCKNRFAAKDRDSMLGMAKNILRENMKVQGYSPENIEKICSHPKFNELLEEYHSLNSSNFMVIGIPKEKADDYIKDSEAFGVLTEESPVDIAHGKKGLDNYEKGKPQARVIVSDSFNDPATGIVMVSGNDTEQVEDLTKGTSISRDFSGTMLEEFFPTPYNWDEDRDMVQRKRLGKQLNNFIKDVVLPLHPEAPKVESSTTSSSESTVAPIKGKSESFASASFSHSSIEDGES